MHPSPPSASKWRGTIQIVAELLIFLLLTAATAFLLRPLQADMTKRMSILRDSFIATAEKSLGRRLEYRSMGPALFRSIDLREVRVIGADGAVPLSLSRLRIEYSLVDLLRGDLAGAFRGLLLERPVVQLDLERDADLVDRLSSFLSSGSRSDVPLSLTADSRVRVRSGAFFVSGKGYRVSLDDVDLDIAAREGRFSVNARAAIEYQDSRLPAEFNSVKTAFSLNGDTSADLRRADFKLSFSRLSVPAFSVLKQGALISYSEGVWEVRKSKDRMPFDFRFRYDPKTGQSGASLVMEDFVPARMVEAAGTWAAYAPWLESRLSGRAEVTFASAESFSYRFDLRTVASGSVPVAGAVLDLQGEGDQSTLQLRKASAKSAAGTLEFEGAVALKPIRPEGTLRVTDVRLSEETKISAVFQLSAENDAISLFSDSVYIGGLRLDAFDASLRTDPGVVSFAASALRFQETGKPEESADVRLARIKLDGAYTIKSSYLQASLSLDAFAASDILVVARPLLKGNSPPPQVNSIIDKSR